MIKRSARAAARIASVLLSAAFFACGDSAAQSSLDGLESGLTDLIYRLSRSVVTVEASRQLSAARFGAGIDETYQKETTTGVVVDSNGLILAPVRSVLGFDRLTVGYEGRSVPAEIVAVDYQTELALLRAAEPGGSAAEPDRQHACAGQVVVALGHAFGLRSSPALGFCAGLRDDGTLQFSIPNSGGRLGSGVFDLGGHLLGIVAEPTLNDPSLVMAVPAYQIPELVRHLAHYGDRQSGFVGITSQEIEISPGLPIPRTTAVPVVSGYRPGTIERGVVVTTVLPSSPAARAGLMVGDLIYAVDYMPVNSASGLAHLVRQSQPGTRLQIDILRRTQFLSLPLIVGRKSITLGTVSPTVPGSDQSRLVDSLRHELETMRGQLNRLEKRLDAIKRD
ncbi:MAG: S1C family serine protease [Candidatus Zixiibacteriota bacterium]